MCLWRDLLRLRLWLRPRLLPPLCRLCRPGLLPACQWVLLTLWTACLHDWCPPCAAPCWRRAGASGWLRCLHGAVCGQVLGQEFSWRRQAAHLGDLASCACDAVQSVGCQSCCLKMSCCGVRTVSATAGLGCDALQAGPLSSLVCQQAAALPTTTSLPSVSALPEGTLPVQCCDASQRGGLHLRTSRCCGCRCRCCCWTMSDLAGALAAAAAAPPALAGWAPKQSAIGH